MKNLIYRYVDGFVIRFIVARSRDEADERYRERYGFFPDNDTTVEELEIRN